MFLWSDCAAVDEPWAGSSFLVTLVSPSAGSLSQGVLLPQCSPKTGQVSVQVSTDFQIRIKATRGDAQQRVPGFLGPTVQVCVCIWHSLPAPESISSLSASPALLFLLLSTWQFLLHRHTALCIPEQELTSSLMCTSQLSQFSCGTAEARLPVLPSISCMEQLAGAQLPSSAEASAASK